MSSSTVYFGSVSTVGYPFKYQPVYRMQQVFFTRFQQREDYQITYTTIPLNWSGSSFQEGGFESGDKKLDYE